MELLRPILSKLELICQQPAISQWGGVQWGKPASSGTREDGWALQAVFWTWGYLVPVTQRAHSAVITSLWRRNHVTAAFWRHNHVISAWCVRWVIDFLFCTGEIYLSPWWLLISQQWVQNNIFLWTPGIFKFTPILQSRFFSVPGDPEHGASTAPGAGARECAKWVILEVTPLSSRLLEFFDWLAQQEAMLQDCG